MWHWDDGMGWWMLWGAIIALVVWAVQALTRRDAGQTPPTPPGPERFSSLDIVKERYARGEIGREEFERLKRELEET